MLKHYFTIAIRNLWRYKVQTIISIVGLAIGFTCFSLSAFWMKYESSFDTFHPKADRIYRLYGIDKNKSVNRSSSFPAEVATPLIATFPEIESIGLATHSFKRVDNGTDFIDFQSLDVNNDFCDIFDLPDYVRNYDNQNFYVVSDKVVKSYFHGENPAGKELKLQNQDAVLKIKDIVNAWPLNTDLYFDFISANDTVSDRLYHDYYILLHKGVDVKSFEDKLWKYENNEIFAIRTKNLGVIPLTSFRQSQLNYSGVIKYSQIEMFAFAGLLIVICAIFNYLILLLSHIRMRGRELALRKVNGASGKSFLLLFGCEFIVILLSSLLLGLVFLEIILPFFKQLSGIGVDNVDIYIHVLSYSLLLIIIILLPVFAMIEYFKRKTLQESIIKQSANSKVNWFYKISVLVQLMISIGFIFSTTVFIKQINYLSQVDLGFKRDNIFQLYTSGTDISPIFEKIKAIPTINNGIITSGDIWGGSHYQAEINEWDGKEDDKPVMFRFTTVPLDFFDFYGMTLVEGKIPEKGMENYDQHLGYYYLNEAAIKFIGWDDPLGKMLRDKKIGGVVKDFILQPKEAPLPIIFQLSSSSPESLGQYKTFLFQYKEGTKIETEQAITTIMEKEFSGEKFLFLYKEDAYKSFFDSENALLLILQIATVICIIISIFGIYSMVSLICTRRRKEIAIRKVNGATVSSILSQLIKEQLILLFIASLIVFPVVTFIMKRWIENYIKQTEISWWIYTLIFISMLLIVTITIFSQVWRAANQNPAEVLKSE